MKLYYETSLSHHGIKGQKWGVRRFQDKDGRLTAAGRRRMYKELEKDRKKFQQDEQARLEKKYDLDGRVDRAYEYGRKNKLDRDDGGGPSKDGFKYMQMWDDIEKISDNIDREVAKNVRGKLIDKYGEDTLNDFEKAKKHDKRFDAAMEIGAGVVTSILVLAGIDYITRRAQGY